METYTVSLVGETPLLMHADNLEWQARIERWQKAPENKTASVKGDDRSPAWMWIGSLYHDGDHVAVPTDCLMAAAMKAGASMILKGMKTYKSLTQSGMAFLEPHMPLSVAEGRQVPMSAIEALRSEMDFAAHVEAVRALGFDLDVRRVKVGQSKHVRVRPVFSRWAAQGTLTVWDDALTPDVVSQVWEIAGDQVGILDWRPSAGRPGPFGRFRATVTHG